MKYSIKMHAEQGSRHISGAERIVEKAGIKEALTNLVHRALHHSNGEAETVSLKVVKIQTPITTLRPLPVTEAATTSPAAARAFLAKEVQSLGLEAEAVLDIFYSLQGMRGAVLLDCASLERLEPDPQRGIRVTHMDYTNTGLEKDSAAKNHLKEALCLASKVAHCPCIIGELCMSDDAGYTTGYFASRERGYVRIAHIKRQGDAHGGRLFLFRPMQGESVQECMDYLEQAYVLVQD